MNDLMPRQTITQMVSAYDQAIAAIDSGFVLLNLATDVLDRHFSLSHLNNGLNGMQTVVVPKSPDRIKADVLKSAWDYIIKQSGLEYILTRDRADALREQLRKGEMPPLTVDNVMSTFKNFADNVDTFTTEVVKETFEILRPCRNKYKTNSEYEIGEKIILERYVEFCKYHKTFSVEYYFLSDIRTIDNVFHLLDGKGHAKAPNDLLTALKAACKAGVQEGETEYFKFKFYKKGTLHLTVKNPELVDMLNQRAGGARLKNN